MSSRTTDLSQRQAAVVAGLAYVAIIVLAGYANFFVLEGMVEADDAAATFDNIDGSEAQFRAGVAAFVVVLIADVAVAWGLYVFFKRTSPELSRLAAWLRVVYVGIAGAAALHLIVAARLVDNSGYVSAIQAGERQAQVMLAIDSYLYGWSVGLVVFGVHLLVLGYVMVKSVDAPRLLGMLVMLAGVGYVVSNVALVLLPSYEEYADAFLLLTVVLAVPGEFTLPVWLLWRGGKPKRPGRDRHREKVSTGSRA
ncbi:MAG: DUF4386 domain-containing protein [Nocardioidaceae bacterium]